MAAPTPYMMQTTFQLSSSRSGTATTSTAEGASAAAASSVGTSPPPGACVVGDAEAGASAVGAAAGGSSSSTSTIATAASAASASASSGREPRVPRSHGPTYLPRSTPHVLPTTSLLQVTAAEPTDHIRLFWNTTRHDFWRHTHEISLACRPEHPSPERARLLSAQTTPHIAPPWVVTCACRPRHGCRAGTRP